MAWLAHCISVERGRRLSDLLADLSLIEVQLQLFREGASPHYGRNLGARIAALHRRMDELERRLRLRARALGEDDRATLQELKGRLAAIDRQYAGPERRKANRPDLASGLGLADRQEQ